MIIKTELVPKFADIKILNRNTRVSSTYKREQKLQIKNE
jgi:hypothetical protein